MRIHADLPPLNRLAPALPAPLASLVNRMLAKDKNQRPSMTQLELQFGWWLNRGMSGQHPQ